MKKVLVTLVFVFAVSFMYGQSRSVQKKATANTKEMVKVLSLDLEQEQAIFKINLDKNKKLTANESNESLTAEEKKANKREIYKEAQNGFREVLGKDKVKEWNVFKAAQNEARKKAHN